MFMRKDITDLNPNENLHQMASELINYAPNDLTEDNLHIIDDSTLYMVNDLIFTSAGELDRVVVEKTGGSGFNGFNSVSVEWEHGDNVEW